MVKVEQINEAEACLETSLLKSVQTVGGSFFLFLLRLESPSFSGFLVFHMACLEIIHLKNSNGLESGNPTINSSTIFIERNYYCTRAKHEGIKKMILLTALPNPVLLIL